MAKLRISPAHKTALTWALSQKIAEESKHLTTEGIEEKIAELKRKKDRTPLQKPKDEAHFLGYLIEIENWEKELKRRKEKA